MNKQLEARIRRLESLIREEAEDAKPNSRDIALNAIKSIKSGISSLNSITNEFSNVRSFEQTTRELNQMVLLVESMVSKAYTSDKVSKNELFGFGKLSSKDATDFVKRIKNSGDSILKNLSVGNLSSNKFHASINLPSDLKNKLNGLFFILAQKSDKTLYCSSHDNDSDSNHAIAIVRDFKNNAAGEKTVAKFIKDQIDKAKKKYNIKESITTKNEGLSLDEFTCKQIKELIANKLNRNGEIYYSVSVDDTDAIDGYIVINVKSSRNNMLYEVICNDYNDFIVKDENGTTIRRCKYQYEIANTIAEEVESM